MIRREPQAFLIDSNDTDIDGEIAIAAKYLRDRRASLVFAIGASKGGTAVLGAAARDDQLDGVIAASPVTTFGDVNLTRSKTLNLAIPVLVIVDEEDSSVLDVEVMERWNRPAAVHRRRR